MLISTMGYMGNGGGGGTIEWRVSVFVLNESRWEEEQGRGRERETKWKVCTEWQSTHWTVMVLLIKRPFFVKLACSPPVCEVFLPQCRFCSAGPVCAGVGSIPVRPLTGWMDWMWIIWMDGCLQVEILGRWWCYLCTFFGSCWPPTPHDSH